MKWMLMIVLAGCVSTEESRTPRSPPVILSPIFEGCQSRDGSSQFEVSQASGDPVAILQADWLMGPASFEFEALAPTGQTTFEAKVDRQSGSIVANFQHTITVDQEGRLFVSGYEMPVRLDDLLCALGFRLTTQVAQRLFEVTQESPHWILAGGDRDRTWRIVADPRHYCADFTRSRLFGLIRQVVVICSDIDGSGSVVFDDRYTVKWKSLDEATPKL